MKYIAVVFLLVSAIAIADGAPQIDEIRKHYGEIRQALPELRKTSIELDGHSTDGAVVEGYYSKTGELRFIDAKFYGESGKLYEEYYYHKGELIFLLRQHHQYNVPYYVDEQMAKDAGGVAFDESKTVIQENRYYFHEGKLIRWLDENKRQLDIKSNAAIDKEKESLAFSKELALELKKAVPEKK